MDSGVKKPASLMHAEDSRTQIQDISLDVDFDERRCGDLMVEQAEWIDEKVLLITTQTNSCVIINADVPTKELD